MALDSTRAPFYAFGSSSPSAHQVLHMMQGEGSNGKLFSYSNDESLISFEESYEAMQNSNTGHGVGCFNNSHQAATSMDSHVLMPRGHLKGKANNGDDISDLFYSSDAADDHHHHQTAVHKHPKADESFTPPSKKQCINKKSKAKLVASKDPQSIAAKNRRERISERLRILQELVPNGTKVDLVTMLEKAIGYVKFLQLQVKVLAADEFWPVQGGKAPELSQVKDAIDAILLSQRCDRTSASD